MSSGTHCLPLIPQHNHNQKSMRAASSFLLASAAALACTTALAAPRMTPEGVEIISEPYTDDRWTETAQVLPGKLYFAYCDKGTPFGLCRVGGWVRGCMRPCLPAWRLSLPLVIGLPALPLTHPPTHNQAPRRVSTSRAPRTA